MQGKNRKLQGFRVDQSTILGDGKASICNARDLGSIPGLGRSPGEGSGSPLQYSCLEKTPWTRSLVGYSLWGRKESDTTERLHFCTLYRHCFERGVFVKHWDNLWVPWWLSGKESICNAGDVGSIPGSRRSAGEGNGN